MTHKSFTTAEEVLDRLMEQFEITPPAGLGPNELEQWKDYWVRARKWLGGCVRVFDKVGYEDERLKAHADELLATVVEAVGEADGSDDEWEDEEDSWEGIEDGDSDNDDGAMQS